MNSHNRENAPTSVAAAACSLTQATDSDKYFDHLLAATLELTGVRELASYQSRSEVDSSLFRLLNWSGRDLHNRPRPDTIRLAQAGWKFGLICQTAMRAVLDLRLMLGNFDPYRWQIKNLAALILLTGVSASEV
jgi:hypothetical protein